VVIGVPGDAISQKIAFAFQLAKVTGADAYELERRLGHGSQRYISRYTNPQSRLPHSLWRNFSISESKEVLTALTEAQREPAMERFSLLKPALEDGSPQPRSLRQMDFPFTAAVAPMGLGSSGRRLYGYGGGDCHS